MAAISVRRSETTDRVIAITVGLGGVVGLVSCSVTKKLSPSESVPAIQVGHDRLRGVADRAGMRRRGRSIVVRRGGRRARAPTSVMERRARPARRYARHATCKAPRVVKGMFGRSGRRALHHLRLLRSFPPIENSQSKPLPLPRNFKPTHDRAIWFTKSRRHRHAPSTWNFGDVLPAPIIKHHAPQNGLTLVRREPIYGLGLAS
jgi:hypothetical protein